MVDYEIPNKDVPTNGGDMVQGEDPKGFSTDLGAIKCVRPKKQIQQRIGGRLTYRVNFVEHQDCD